MLTDATALNLINRIDDRTGASVGMFRNVNTAPLQWGKILGAKNAKPAKLLTAPQATRQARRHVDRIMPGVMATVESKLSHDLATDTPTVITTVTFPEGQDGQLKLVRALDSLTGSHGYVWAGSSIVLTRTR